LVVHHNQLLKNEIDFANFFFFFKVCIYVCLIFHSFIHVCVFFFLHLILTSAFEVDLSLLNKEGSGSPEGAPSVDVGIISGGKSAAFEDPLYFKKGKKK